MSGRRGVWVAVIAIAAVVPVATTLARDRDPDTRLAAEGTGSQLPSRGCLHEEPETIMQRDRRLEAIRAMQMIESVAASIVTKRNPSWEELSRASRLQSYRNEGSPAGDLARKIRWGQVEPLPGWRILWVNDRVVVPTFSLTDVWDPCRFTLSSVDPAVIPYPPGRTVPLGTR
jgi:hypothetical protein